MAALKEWALAAVPLLSTGSVLLDVGLPEDKIFSSNGCIQELRQLASTISVEGLTEVSQHKGMWLSGQGGRRP